MSKQSEWIKARRKLIKEGIAEGTLAYVNDTLMGRCKDCGRFLPLTPDHVKKRSQGGSHDKSNIDWVCVRCHNKRDNMPKSKKSKKPEWAKDHKCISCKKQTSQFICNHCTKVSIKIPTK